MESFKTSAAQLLERLPGPSSEHWLAGERFVRAMRHGSMSLEMYAPVGRDPQTPHEQDELYFVHSGFSELVIEGCRYPCEPGDAFFVPAGAEHRFENFSSDFSTWVVFWGPKGGESANDES